jgi:hypothetical protein
MSLPRFDRRTVLRGLLAGTAVSVALPMLEAMAGLTRGALAQSTPPKRFGVWFWGNGVRREHWIPGAVGAGWTPGAELAPLAALRPHFNVLTGYEVKTSRYPHHGGATGILSGAAYQQVGTTRDTIATTFAQPSLDQVVARPWAGRTRFRSLEIGVARPTSSDEGTTFLHLSHNGPNNVNPAEHSPSALFTRLFGAGTTTTTTSTTTTAPSPRDLARRSVLDAVSGQIRGLQTRLGAIDRARLEQHFDSIRSIETRLAASATSTMTAATPTASCTRPAMPTDVVDVSGRDQIEPKNRLMSDLLAVALACDLTRVFSVQFTRPGASTVFWQVGATNSLHGLCHNEALPQPTVHSATTFAMQQLAYFLERLRTTPDGPGATLLDACGVLATTELSEGRTHSVDEFPILIAGRAGGALRTGLHVRSTTRENTSKPLLSLLRAVGLPLTEFGTGLGRVTDGVPAIEV